MFDFGRWKSLDKEKVLVYCGGKIEKKDSSVIMMYGDYIKKALPITINRNRNLKDNLHMEKRRRPEP